MAKLDRSKPHAIVYYDDLGRSFEQDGVFYTAGGEPWVEPDAVPAAGEAKPAAAKAVKAKPAPAAPEDEQLAAQMAGA